MGLLDTLAERLVVHFGSAALVYAPRFRDHA